jgi:hypothetical protein
MKANTRIHEHSAAGSISVQTISGHIRMHVEAREFDLPAGHLLALDAAVPYDVEALEDSAFVLTIAWRGDSRTPAAFLTRQNLTNVAASTNHSALSSHCRRNSPSVRPCAFHPPSRHTSHAAIAIIT